MSNLLEVFDGNEIFVYIADEYEATTEERTETETVSTDDEIVLDVEDGSSVEILSVEDSTEEPIDYEFDEETNTITITEVDLTDEEVTVTYEVSMLDVEWERVDFRRNVDPDIPDTDRDVYDGIRLVGTKPQRDEGINLTIEAEFQGFDRGLWKYENDSGILVKIEIEPHGNYDEEALQDYGMESYYLNWSPENAQFSPPDEGEVTVTLEGSFDRREYEMPDVEELEQWMDEVEEE